MFSVHRAGGTGTKMAAGMIKWLVSSVALPWRLDDVIVDEEVR